MAHPVGMQHILTNSSVAQKAQQTNYTQADGQQKNLANKAQREKTDQQKKVQQLKKSDQLAIKKEQEKEKKQNLLKRQKAQKQGVKERPSVDEGPDNQQEETPRIDILV